MTVVLASPWPCKAYCGRCELCHVASEREVAIRERQLEQRSTRRWRRAHVPLDRTEREALLRDVMRNLRVQLGPGPASGEEVDRLVRELTSGRSEDWATFSQWVMSYIRGRAAVMGVPSEGVDDVASAVLEKVARALMARQQLSSAEPTRDTVPALLACFTHTFPLRPWAASLSKNALSDAQRRLRFEDTTLDAYHADHGELVAQDPPVDELVYEGLPSTGVECVPELLSLIDAEQRKQRKRALHLRHTLARLPDRYVKVLDAVQPSLQLRDLPRAASDTEMAANLATSVSNVESTRANFRTFIAREHPELVRALELVLVMALGNRGPTRARRVPNPRDRSSSVA